MLGRTTSLSTTMDKTFKKLTLAQTADTHFSCGTGGVVDISMALLMNLWYRCKPHVDLPAWTEETKIIHPKLHAAYFLFFIPSSSFSKIDQAGQYDNLILGKRCVIQREDSTEDSWNFSISHFCWNGNQFNGDHRWTTFFLCPSKNYVLNLHYLEN